MVNIVKTIENLAANPGDYQLMKTLKKQLKGSGNEKNKLRQSSVDPDWMIAPIHAAAKSDSVEVFKLVLGTKGVTDSVSIMTTCEGEKYFSALDCAIVETQNLGIIKLILESDLDLVLTTTDDIPGQRVSKSVSIAVKEEYLEVIDLLHTDAQEGEEGVEKYLTMMVAIVFNKKKVFTHVLCQAKEEINNRFKTENNEYWTLLDLAQFYRRSEICKQLEEAAKDNSESQEWLNQFNSHELMAMLKTVTPDDLLEEDEEASTGDKDRVKICWNCSRSADTTPLLKCKGCRKARYCDDKCQAEDWEVHADYCEKKMKKRALKYRKESML